MTLRELKEKIDKLVEADYGECVVKIPSFIDSSRPSEEVDRVAIRNDGKEDYIKLLTHEVY